jgi:predicted Zn-dependent protease
MLQSVSAIGDELRWFSSVGVPYILLSEMTLAGV